MNIPQKLYGTYKTVASETRRAVTRIVKGVNLSEALNTNETFETGNLPGQIMIERPYPGEGEEPGFYVCALGELLGHGRNPVRRFSLEREAVLFDQLLETPWGLTTLLGRHNGQLWLVDSPERMRQYLAALERHRAALDAVGARFSGGTSGDSSKPWWNFPGGAIFALANLGVVRADLDGLMDSGTIPAWRRTRQILAAD